MAYYLTIPNTVRHADIPDGAKLLFGDIANLSKREGYCYASNQFLADVAGVSKRTVEGYIAHLEAAGFITREGIDGGKQDTRKIYIATQEFATPTQESATTHENGCGDTHAESCDITIKEQQESKTNTQESVREEFESLWERYGKLGNKASALNCYIKLTKAERAEVHEYVDGYVKATNTDGTYPSRMHLSTYLSKKKKRWLDEIPEVKSSRPGAMPLMAYSDMVAHARKLRITAGSQRFYEPVRVDGSTKPLWRFKGL